MSDSLYLLFLVLLPTLVLTFGLPWLFNRDAKRWLEDHPHREAITPQCSKPPEVWVPRFSRVKFEVLIEAALDRLPEEIKHKLEGVEIGIDDWPDEALMVNMPHGIWIMGTYIGANLAEIGSRKSQHPRVIKVFQGPVELCSPNNESDTIATIEKVILHEVGHHLGMNHERMAPLGL